MHYLLLLQLLNSYKAELAVLQAELVSLQAQASSTVAVESIPIAPIIPPTLQDTVPVVVAPQPQIAATQTQELGIAAPLPENQNLLKFATVGSDATDTTMEFLLTEPANVFTVDIQGPCELDYTGSSTDLGTFDPTQVIGSNQYALVLDSSAVGIQAGHQYCYTLHIESADSQYDGTNFFVTPSASSTQ